jgi:predicted SprT family Zn-dependent metalloprotease
VNPKRSKPSEFYVPALKTFIDLDQASHDWKEINLTHCKIQSIFDRLKDLYFSKWLNNVKYTVLWDYYGAYTGDLTYKIVSSTSTIYISDKVLTRPRIQLMSLVLHILIHIYLYFVSNTTIRFDQHGSEFKSIMKFFNDRILTSICTSHIFLYNSDESMYSTQWWQCTGICVNYQPFYGIIRCTATPHISM